MDEVLARRKRTGALLIIPLVLVEMIVGACFLYVLLYMPNSPCRSVYSGSIS